MWILKISTPTSPIYVDLPLGFLVVTMFHAVIDSSDPVDIKVHFFELNGIKAISHNVFG